jgi:hypothetical protein
MLRQRRASGSVIVAPKWGTSRHSASGKEVAQIVADLTQSAKWQRDGTAQQLDYYVFLSMRTHDQPNEPKVIRLFVESAYPEDLLHYDRPTLGKPMPLTRALAECWGNRPGAETGRRR